MALMSTGKKAVSLILLIVVADQILKFWVKTHMVIGEERSLFGDWGLLHFIENNGMAFGMEIGGKTGKIILSLFRIAAITAIGWFLHTLVKKET
jgi:signal peptidase II